MKIYVSLESYWFYYTLHCAQKVDDESKQFLNLNMFSGLWRCKQPPQPPIQTITFFYYMNLELFPLSGENEESNISTTYANCQCSILCACGRAGRDWRDSPDNSLPAGICSCVQMGTFGPDCLKRCDCVHSNGCQAATGECHCLPGWWGKWWCPPPPSLSLPSWLRCRRYIWSNRT